MFEWCEQNCNEEWLAKHYIKDIVERKALVKLYFKAKSGALAFVLRWSD